MGSLFNAFLVSCCMAIVINCEGKFANKHRAELRGILEIIYSY